MAVEIRELIIKAVIVDDPVSSSDDGEEPASVDTSKIVQECVTQVLKILKKGKNR